MIPGYSYLLMTPGYSYLLITALMGINLRHMPVARQGRQRSSYVPEI
jgi:hypothetical protein